MYWAQWNFEGENRKSDSTQQKYYESLPKEILRVEGFPRNVLKH